MEVLRTAVFQLMYRRSKDGFLAKEVVQQLYPEDWEVFLPELFVTLAAMQKTGLVELVIDGIPVNPTPENFSEVKIQKPNKLI